jgi:hypothetical protein
VLGAISNHPLGETFGLIAGGDATGDEGRRSHADHHCERSTVLCNALTRLPWRAQGLSNGRVSAAAREAQRGRSHTAASMSEKILAHAGVAGEARASGRAPQLARLDWAEHDAITAPLEGERSLREMPAWLAALQTREHRLRGAAASLRGR